MIEVGLSNARQYYDSSGDSMKVYKIVEAEKEADGFIIVWKLLYGQKLYPVKHYGKFQTVEEAQDFLDIKADKFGWESEIKKYA